MIDFCILECNQFGQIFRHTISQVNDKKTNDRERETEVKKKKVDSNWQEKSSQ